MPKHPIQLKEEYVRLKLDQIERGPDPRTDWARSSFQNDVIWLLCLIARKVL
jgi:hypothetical protein